MQAVWMLKACVLVLFVLVFTCEGFKGSTHTHPQGKASKAIRKPLGYPFPFNYTEVKSNVYPALDIALDGKAKLEEPFIFQVNLAAQEVADFSMTLLTTDNLVLMDIYLMGTVMAWETYPSYYTPYDHVFTLAEHCLLYNATYVMVISVASGTAVFLLDLVKRSGNVPYGLTTGSLVYLAKGHMAIPVTSECKKLVINLKTTQNLNVYLEYMCRVYDELVCPQIVGSDNQIAVYTSTKLGTEKADEFYYQFVVNCTIPGIYQLVLLGQYSYMKDDFAPFTIMVTDEYPCNDCGSDRYCDFSNLKCRAATEHHCTGSECPHSHPASYVPPLIDIPSDKAFQYENANASGSPLTVYPLRMISNTTSSQLIRLAVSVHSDFQASHVSLDFNPGSVPTEHNSTSSYWVNGNTKAMDVPLCGGVDAWYIAITDYIPVDPRFLPVIIFEPTIVDIIIVGNHFIDDFANLTGLSYMRAYQFRAETAFMQVVIAASANLVTGIALYDSCNSVSHSQYDTYETEDVIYYQYSLPSNIGNDYYLLVEGRSKSTTFIADIYMTDVPGKCAFDCNQHNKQGFCSAVDNTCKCRYGWTGADCGILDLANGITLLDGIVFNMTITEQALFIPPLIPVGYQLFLAAKTDGILTMCVDVDQIPYPSWNDEYWIYPNTFTYLPITKDPQLLCLPNRDIQPYITVTPDIPVNASFEARLVNVMVPSDGTPTMINIENLNLITLVVPLPLNCSGAYKISVNHFNASIYVSYSMVVENHGKEECAYYDLFLEDDNLNFTGTAHLRKCTPIYISITSYGGSNIEVSVTPTPACPNFCSGQGECEQGVCYCPYPYIGDDCSSYDSPCSDLRAELSTCKSTSLATYEGGFEYSGLHLCDMRYDDLYTIPYIVNQIIDDLAFINISLSASCQDEIWQIACDYYFPKCAPQNSGGNKVLVPCNIEAFLERCVNNSDFLSFEFLSLQGAVGDRLRDLPYSLCDPNPFSDNVVPKTISSGRSPLAILLFVVCLTVMAFLLTVRTVNPLPPRSGHGIYRPLIIIPSSYEQSESESESDSEDEGIKEIASETESGSDSEER